MAEWSEAVNFNLAKNKKMTYKVVLYPRLMLKGLSRKTRGKGKVFHKRAPFPASTCEEGCKDVRGRLQVLAGTVAVHPTFGVIQ